MTDSASIRHLPGFAKSLYRLPHSLAAILVPAALLWTAGSTLSVYPHQLAYFNELAGGPDQGHRHLLRSNLDWSQDYLFVRDWMQREDIASDDVRILSSILQYEPGDLTPILACSQAESRHWEIVSGNTLVRERYSRLERLDESSTIRLGAATWAMRARNHPE